MKKIYCLLFLIFIELINCLPENINPNEITSTRSYSEDLAMNQNSEDSNNEVNSDDPGVFIPMEDFDEEAIDAYCVDISNDCAEREHFCQNPAFHETMLERCPRTCNLCKELISRRTLPTTTIEEEEEAGGGEDYVFPEVPETPKPLPITLPPRTTLPPPTPSSHEVTPSISLTQLVGSAENHISDIEEAALEKSSTPTTKRTKKLRARRVCRDLASDCNTKLRLCKSTFYSAIMERFCSKSCNFCSNNNGSHERQTFKKHKVVNRPNGNSRPLPRNRSTSRVRQTATTCLDVGIDCNEKRSLCTHRSYTTLMRRMCPSTCNMCATV